VKTHFFLICFSIFAVTAVSSNAPAKATVNDYIENFTTKQYCDTLNTTAWWDTIGGELKLYPFEVTLAGSYDTPGTAYGVVTSGDYAYVADRASGLQVIDISDPTNPSSAGNYDTPGSAYDVAVAGDYAYVADDVSGLQVIDISDPTNPSSAGSYNTPGSAYTVAVSGDYAYVGDGTSGLRVIDISDPTNPSSAANYDTPGTAWGVDISGDYAYVADRASGLQVIDISDPTNPSLAGSYDTSLAFDVAVSGDYAYVTDYNSGLRVIDITDPTNPSSAGNYDTPGSAYCIAISGDYAYVGDGISGLQVIDISDPMMPSLAGNYDTPGTAFGVAVSGDRAFVGDYSSGLLVIDICDLVIPSAAGDCETPDPAGDVAIAGDYAYIAGGISGLQVIDISDPTNPSIAGSYATPGIAYGVVVEGDYTYIADFNSGLQVIDISDPTNPALAGNYDTPGSAFDVAVAGDYAYVADSDSGLQVIDISDPTSPALAGSCDTPGNGVAIEGDYAYVADNDSGLQVIDISDPTNPSLASYGTPDAALDVAVSGDYAYGADFDSGLQVIDISDPTKPSSVGNYDTPGFAFALTVSGDYAYVADYYSLQVIDISDPTNPWLAGSYDTPGVANNVAIEGDYAYVTGSGPGLNVVQVFQRSYGLVSNEARSLVLNSLTDTITVARLNTTQTDSIRWELSADGGINWREVNPTGTWHDLTDPGTALMWRSSHYYVGGLVNPACTNLMIEWLYNFAVIDSIVDVPDDQGGWVRVYFSRSALDDPSEGEYPVTGYYLFRRIDDIGLQGRILAEGMRVDRERIATNSLGAGDRTVPQSMTNSTVILLDGRCFVVGASAASEDLPPGIWEVVGSVPAHQEDQYICLAPTLADSTSSSLVYSVYCISAETTTPSVYDFSPPDSGYSVDNIAPGVPTGFSVAYNAGSSTELTWDPCQAEDFQYFCIYRGESEDFQPDPENRVHLTIDTSWLDTVEEGWRYYYKITAVDYAGNESDPASAGTVTAVTEPVIPQVFALHQNVPNPFNPVTTIRYDVPAGGGEVTLRVYDVGGRLVRTLVDGTEGPGEKTVTWDGRNDRGRVVASGVYFYRLTSETYTHTRKMLLMK
jgi:hypothetical protein